VFTAEQEALKRAEAEGSGDDWAFAPLETQLSRQPRQRTALDQFVLEASKQEHKLQQMGARRAAVSTI
jgi:hypothetical protein